MKTNKPKLTRERFCQIYPEQKKVRVTDNYQFEVNFNDWKRQRQMHW